MRISIKVKDKLIFSKRKLELSKEKFLKEKLNFNDYKDFENFVFSHRQYIPVQKIEIEKLLNTPSDYSPPNKEKIEFLTKNKISIIIKGKTFSSKSDVKHF